MRSSIACVRCRRSKVKCVNTGPNTTCRACEASNRECTYPAPVASGGPRLSTGSAAIRTSSGAVGASRDIAPGIAGGVSTLQASAAGDRAEVCKKPRLHSRSPFDGLR
jgi:Fungal Zn(2)-Cys(6) binuclear cluster domain